MSANEPRTVQEKLALAGASLFFVGLITGIWSAAALTGTVQVKIPHLALAAHLNGLLGGLWLVAVSATLGFLKRYDERQRKVLAYWVAVPCWANWFVTLIASFVGVEGLKYGGDPSNSVIAALLQALVVFPALVGAFLWVRGFFPRSA